MYESVLHTSLFRGIHIQDPEYIESLFAEQPFSRNQVIFRQGQAGNGMYIIKSGSLKIYSESDSKEIVFGHQFPGETIGELEAIHYDNTRLASVAALEDSVLWVIAKEDLDILIALYPEILRKAFYVMCERLQQADRKLEYLAFLDARIRVANLLLDLHANFGIKTEEGLLINWKITHQHFANMIGIGRESATRILQEFQAKGILTIQNKFIVILNLSALERCASSACSAPNHRNWHSTWKYTT